MLEKEKKKERKKKKRKKKEKKKKSEKKQVCSFESTGFLFVFVCCFFGLNSNVDCLVIWAF